MDVEDNLSLKKESQDLINLLREKWKKEGLYFDENFLGKTSLEYHPKINPLHSPQKILDHLYYGKLPQKLKFI